MMPPGMMKVEFDESQPLFRDPEVGLVLPPWAPPQMRVQMGAMPIDKKRMVMQQQVRTVKQALGLNPNDTSIPTDEQYKRWLKLECENMKKMMAGGGGGGHSHGGVPCNGNHSHGGGGGGHSHGGHSHGGHSHGGYGGGGGGGGHSHGGVPCNGHSHGGGGGHSHGGHSHGGAPGGPSGGMNPMAALDGLLRPQAALNIPKSVTTDYTVDEESKLVIPAYMPAAEGHLIRSMSARRRQMLRRHQIMSIRASAGKLQGTTAAPTEADLAEPTEEETKQWIKREWTKMNLMAVDPTPPQALVGGWVYGRRTDGMLSEYHFCEADGGVRYEENTLSGATLTGKVVPAADAPAPPADAQFKAAWHVALEDGKGLLWFRVVDGATIESLFVNEGASVKGFKAAARRAWATLAGAPEPSELMLGGDLVTDKESGLSVPPWAPDMAHKQMKMMPLAERKRVKAMQDVTVRQVLGLPEDHVVGEKDLKDWMVKSYNDMLTQQQQMARMSDEQRAEMMQKKMDEQKAMMEKVAAAGKPTAAPVPESAEEADIQSQLAVINRMVMQNMQTGGKNVSKAEGPKGPKLD